METLARHFSTAATSNFAVDCLCNIEYGCFFAQEIFQTIRNTTIKRWLAWRQQSFQQINTNKFSYQEHYEYNFLANSAECIIFIGKLCLHLFAPIYSLHAPKLLLKTNYFWREIVGCLPKPTVLLSFIFVSIHANIFFSNFPNFAHTQSIRIVPEFGKVMPQMSGDFHSVIIAVVIWFVLYFRCNCSVLLRHYCLKWIHSCFGQIIPNTWKTCEREICIHWNNLVTNVMS